MGREMRNTIGLNLTKWRNIDDIRNEKMGDSRQTIALTRPWKLDAAYIWEQWSCSETGRKETHHKRAKTSH